MPRTQEDRTAATRTAVLEATAQLLFERGYAGTSTRLAAERAGISLGALQHHFPTKASLTVEAMRHLVRQLADEFVAAAPAAAPPDLMADVLDRLWVVFRGPSFAAGVELLVAARTDPALRDPMREFQHEVERIFVSRAAELLPDLASRPGFPGLLALTTSSLRGLALIAIEPDTGATTMWEPVRAQLLAAAEHVLDEEHP